MTRRKRAIKYIKECKRVHEGWILAQERGELTTQDIRIGGGKTWHKKWVKQYQLVLKELRK